MSKTDIEWTGKNGRSWNPLVGCNKKSTGCKNCYALTMSARVANAARQKDNPTKVQRAYMRAVKYNEDKEQYEPKWTGKMIELHSKLTEPIRWQKPSIVFVNSMSDLFHPDVERGTIDRVFAAMALAPKHFFLILTKRPDRMRRYCQRTLAEQMDGRTTGPQAAAMFHFDEIEDAHHKVNKAFGSRGYLINVGLGTSVENQATLDVRGEDLCETPAHMRFLSCEPLLGPLDLEPYFYDANMLAVASTMERYDITMGEALDKVKEKYPDEVSPSHNINWVITGGESGHNARPMKPAWEHEIMDQCDRAGVPYFFKQSGAWVGELHPNFDGESNGTHGYWKGDIFTKYHPDNEGAFPQGLVMQKQGLKNPPPPDRAIHEWPEQITQIVDPT